ncbi:MAG: hypothetical protein IPN34_02490 [Planctomycetes bacterium]|nr:hypothetical protein [Planctomycetota bacterium]
MVTIYWICALVGGAFMVLQFLLTLMGFDHDIEADVANVDAVNAVHEGVGVGQISLRTIVAFLTFFGLGGLAANEGGWDPAWTLLLASGLGVGAFYGVGWLMLQLHRLRSSGNIDIKNAVGAQAQVYLTIPARKSGAGKITVTVQGRSVEFKAQTSGEELHTGSACRVVSVLGPDLLLVETAT